MLGNMDHAMLRYRTIFLSDIHLGTSDCQADFLYEFLQNTTCETLYLVGDVVDLWKLRSSIQWPRVKNRIAQLIIDKAASGTRVIYIPGNHDELLRDFVGSEFNGVELLEDHVHESATGKRLLVLHGDIFDEVVKTMSWVDDLGSGLYEVIMYISRLYNRIRNWFGYSYWSFAAFIKYKFAEAVRYIHSFEQAAMHEARNRGFDGIVCGHIHHPNVIENGDVLYLNTGDWVEHCTAIVEDEQGQFQLLDWVSARESLQQPAELKRVA